MMYTYKTVQKVARRACDNEMLPVLAVLSDRYKFKRRDLERLMKDVAFASRNLGDLVNRQDLKEIIEERGEVKV